MVRLPSGGLRAVCGSSPVGCDAIDLEPHDVVILEVNRQALAAALARELCTAPAATIDTTGRLIRLGAYAVAAGVSAEVLLSRCDARDGLSDADLRAVGVSSDPVILLLTNAATISPELRSSLIQRGHLVLCLESIMAATGPGALAAVQTAQALFASIHDALTKRLKHAAGPARVTLPAGTLWPQVTLTLADAETLTLTAHGYARRLDPGELGMRNAKNGKPTSAWTFLTLIIAGGGVLKARSPEKAKKQKQELAARLRRACGINADPMPWDRPRGGYVAAFICRDERTPAVRRGADRR